MFEKKRIETIINNMKDAIIGLSEKQIRRRIIFLWRAAILILLIYVL